jgi:hypothetical protein
MATCLCQKLHGCEQFGEKKERSTEWLPEYIEQANWSGSIGGKSLFGNLSRVRQAIWLGSIMAGRKVQNGCLSTAGYLVRMHYGGKSSK